MPKSKEIKKIKELFIETAASQKQFEDSLKIIETVVSLENVGNVMKEKVIDCMLWNITGRAEGKDGKYLTRYRSEKAMEDPEALLIHEHVYKRKNLIQKIIDCNGVTPEIKENIIGCVVTKEEHDQLHGIGKGVDGWERYKEAQIQIKDMLIDKIVKY